MPAEVEPRSPRGVFIWTRRAFFPGFAMFLFLYHVVFALFLRLKFQLNIEADTAHPWNWFWQAVPMDLLREKPWESLWNLHSVPPLHNLLMAFLVRISSEPVQFLHGIHIVLGATVPALLYTVLVAQGVNRVAAGVLGFLIASDPSLFIFEAFMLYDLVTAWLVVVSVFFLSKFSDTTLPRNLLAFIITVNLLALERSTFHWLFVLFCVAAGAVYAGGWRKKYLVLCSIICMPLMVWVGKNFVKFDNPGTSSWMGLSLWKVASIQNPEAQIDELVDEGKIAEEISRLPAFSRPSEYTSGRYKSTSPVDVLNRDDFHNVAVLEISQDYGNAARVLIKNNPGHYLRNVLQSYYVFSRPTVDYMYVQVQRTRIAGLAQFYARYISGGFLKGNTQHPSARSSFYAVGIPIVLFGGISIICVAMVRSRSSFPPLPMLVPAFIILTTIYVISVSSLFEILEGDRYKLYIEHSFWALILILVKRAGSLFRGNLIT